MDGKTPNASHRTFITRLRYKQTRLLGCTLMMAGISLLCGFLLLGFNASYVNTLPKLHWEVYWCKFNIYIF